MRIAIYHNLPSGGAKRTLHDSVSRLKLGHRIDVYTLTTADHDFCDLRPHVERYDISPFRPSALFQSPLGRLNQAQRWRDLWRLDRLSRRLAARIDAETYDVVLAHPCIWTQAPLILRYLCTPTVYFCHEPPRVLYEERQIAEQKNGGWRKVADQLDPLVTLYRSTARKMDRAATRSACRVLVNSGFTHDAVNAIYDLNPEVSYFGVDAELFRPMPEIRREPYVLSVGAIGPHKGYDFLIESLGAIESDQRPPLRLIGNATNTSYRQFLETLARQQGVDLQIEVNVSQELLLRFYNEASLFVYAPRNEPFGLTPLEAMACELAVVGVDEGGVRETVKDNVTGRLVQRDPHRFAGAILELLQDPLLRQRYGQQARAYVLDLWTWERSMARLEQHLEDVSRSCPYTKN